MYTDSQVRNLSNIKQRLRACLTSWNGASRYENKRKFYEYLGIRMRQRRLELGYTQTRIAKICDCTFQQVQKREKGHVLCNICRLLLKYDEIWYTRI